MFRESSVGTIGIECEDKRYFESDFVLNCSGLYADKISTLLGGSKYPILVSVRGDYMKLKDPSLVKSMIYPVPNPQFPFLGNHITKKINGEVWLGPNAMLAFSREGYKLTDFSLRDMLQLPSSLFKLTWRYDLYLFIYFFWLCLARNKGWVLKELMSGLSSRSYVNQVKRFININENDVERVRGGVRALALSESGDIVEDFVVEKLKYGKNGRVVNVRNAPSPVSFQGLYFIKSNFLM